MQQEMRRWSDTRKGLYTRSDRDLSGLRRGETRDEVTRTRRIIDVAASNRGVGGANIGATSEWLFL